MTAEDGRSAVGSMVVAHPRLSDRSEALLGAVAAYLESQGWALRHVDLAKSKERPRRSADFVATPAVLVAGWRAAGFIEGATNPGDTVVLGELGAAGGGMFALEQRLRPSSEKRRTVVAAGDGEALQHLAVTGTIDGVGDDAAHAIDWELVAYRHADLVLATSALAVSMLADLGVAAQLAVVPSAGASSHTGNVGTVALVDPPSRLAQTGTILRALAPQDIDVWVADGASPDLIFKGTAWEAIAGTTVHFGDRLRRGEPDQADAVIVGDPFRLPDAALERWRLRARIMAPEGSALAAAWPDAETWSDADSLEQALRVGGATSSLVPTAPLVLDDVAPDEGRARQVSVAIPVYRDVRFLGECVDSILAQSQPPHEVFLVDDGSLSPEVVEALERERAKSPAIRVIVQPNRGVCVARNAAWDEMTGDAMLFVDADDVLEPDFIEATATALRRDPGLWAAAAWTRFFGEYEGVEAKPPFDRRVGLRENPIVGTAVLLGPEVKAAGIRFSPDLAFLYCEDWDVWSQIIGAGGRVGLVPRPLACHRVHPDSGGFRRTPLAESLGKARATSHLRR